MAAGPDLMTSSVFIAADWGSTNLRVYLCQHHLVQDYLVEHHLIESNPSSATEPLRVLATKSGPGVLHINEGSFEETFFDLVADWLEVHGPLRVLLSGAVGSTVGWRDAPYLDCPVDAEQIIAGRTVFQARGLEFLIVSGLKTQGPLGAPDLMRGEELQLLGWMRLQSKQVTEQVIILPGTHNKWVLVKNDRVETFATALTGELYSLLENHSILITEPQEEPFSADWFMQGVNLAKRLQSGQLLQALFTTRSRQVAGDLSTQQARSYLSGLLVGADILGSIGLFTDQVAQLNKVVLIGDSTLTHAYQLALKSFAIEAQICDSTEIAMAGYQAIYESFAIDNAIDNAMNEER